MTREEARALGLSRYNTGYPCERGHLSDRRTSSAHCLECRRTTCRTPEYKAQRRVWRNKLPAKTLEKRRRQSVECIMRRRQYALEKVRKSYGLVGEYRPCPALCECCGQSPGKTAMCLDHCHETGLFRGWLCRRCNAGLGSLGDNATGVKRMLAYLEAHENECCPPSVMSSTEDTILSTRTSGIHSHV